MSKALNDGNDLNTNETRSIEPGYQVPAPARTPNPLPRFSTPEGIGANSRRELPGPQRTCRFDRPDRHWLSYLSACWRREKSTSWEGVTFLTPASASIVVTREFSIDSSTMPFFV